jgi:hypothetical protein
VPLAFGFVFDEDANIERSFLRTARYPKEKHMARTMTIMTLDDVEIATGLQVFTNRLKRGNVEMTGSDPFGCGGDARVAVRHDDGSDRTR